MGTSFRIAAALTLGLTYGACEIQNRITTSDTQYQGQIVKFGQEGTIWPTYEGTIALGGNLRSNNAYFSLDRQARKHEDIQVLAWKLNDAL